MATDVVEEVVEEEEVETTGRKRAPAPNENYQAIWNTKEEAVANPPKLNGEEVQGFRPYKIEFTDLPAQGDIFFVHARNNDQANSFILKNYAETELADHKPGQGRKAKFEKPMLRYLWMMHKSGMATEIAEFLEMQPKYGRVAVEDITGLTVDDLIAKYCN